MKISRFYNIFLKQIKNTSADSMFLTVTIRMTTRENVTRMIEMRMRIQDIGSNISGIFFIGGRFLGGLDAQTVPSRPTG